MRRFALGLLGACLAVGATSCAPAVTYYKLSLEADPGTLTYTGTDCPMTSLAETTDGLGGNATVAIYPEAKNASFLDLGTGFSSMFGFGNTTADLGLNGSQSGSSYHFAGTWNETAPSMSGPEDAGTPAVTTSFEITVSLSTSGSGFKGTLTMEGKCESASGTDCGPYNPLTSAVDLYSLDGKNFDCTVSTPILGAEEPAPEEVSATGTTTGGVL